ncbi:hypothetical protein Peur_001280 [Populus x canadensis]
MWVLWYFHTFLFGCLLTWLCPLSLYRNPCRKLYKLFCASFLNFSIKWALREKL